MKYARFFAFFFRPRAVGVVLSYGDGGRNQAAWGGWIFAFGVASQGGEEIARGV
ncbi:MAG: hypothetical protein WDN28_20005 [Chthoniobacter sp.]